VKIHNRNPRPVTVLTVYSKVGETELGYEKCILETGKKQPEAIALYKKNGYKLIPNYGQYAEVENSVCFEKEMKKNYNANR